MDAISGMSSSRSYVLRGEARGLGSSGKLPQPGWNHLGQMANNAGVRPGAVDRSASDLRTNELCVGSGSYSTMNPIARHPGWVRKAARSFNSKDEGYAFPDRRLHVKGKVIEAQRYAACGVMERRRATPVIGWRQARTLF